LPEYSGFERTRYLNNLAFALALMYERQKRLEDLEEAIENSRKACELGKSSPDEAISLNKLSTNLHKLYGHTKEKDCLEDAVKYGLQVWELIGQDPNSPFHQACAHNVALVLTRRFRLLGAQKVFNDAVSLYLKANELRSQEDLERTTTLFSLGDLYSIPSVETD
jgi:tetratricopeptide (TPR) repeat protein